MKNDFEPQTPLSAEDSQVGAPNTRREFLKQSAAATGAVISLSVLGAAQAHSATPSATPSAAKTDKTEVSKTEVSTPQTLQLSLKEHPALGKIGGFEIVPIEGDKLIVARTEAASFVACSAICPHKGCPVEYEHSSKEFVCPCHDSRFSLDGKVLKGPAKTPLKNYATDVAAVVTLGTSIAKKASGTT